MRLPQKFLKSLTYFTREQLRAGALVKIRLQSKPGYGIVESVISLRDKKLSLKQGSFAVKKLDEIISQDPPFHPALLSIARELSKYYLEPEGNILRLFLPQIFLESPLPQKYLHIKNPFQHTNQNIIAGSLEYRTDFYKQLLREAYAKQKSIVLFVPTASLAIYYYGLLKNNLKNIILIHGSLSKKEFVLVREHMKQKVKPYTLIGTPLMLGLLEGHEDIIIIDDAESRHYQRPDAPHINTKKAIKLFAHEIQSSLTEGKYFPSLIDLASDTQITPLGRSKKRRDHILIDMAEELDSSSFPLLSGTLAARLLASGSRTLLYVSRKGFFSFVVCYDCGHFMACPQCQRPLILHDETRRVYVCHACKSQVSSDIRCQKCGSWNLRGYGVGTERIAREIKKLLPGRPYWIFDEENIKNETRRKKVKGAFAASADGMLIGTEMILEEPELAGDFVAVVHLDNLFSLPDFRIHERILTILLKLEEKTKNPMLLQTRFPQHPLFQHFITGRIRQFLDDELAERKTENLPPFSLFVKVSIESKNASDATAKIKALQSRLENFGKEVLTYQPLRIPGKKKIWRAALVFLTREDVWIKNEEMIRKELKTFAFDWDIAVDPPDTV